jgi:hypothetical protein
MKIVCIDKLFYSLLTVNITYDIIEEEKLGYLMINNKGYSEYRIEK